MAKTQLDFKATSDWAEINVENFYRPAKYTKFNSGQSNPTYLIETSKKKYVLRKKPEGILLKSAHAVDREYRVQLALQNSVFQFHGCMLTVMILVFWGQNSILWNI